MCYRITSFGSSFTSGKVCTVWILTPESTRLRGFLCEPSCFKSTLLGFEGFFKFFALFLNFSDVGLCSMPGCTEMYLTWVSYGDFLLNCGLKCLMLSRRCRDSMVELETIHSWAGGFASRVCVDWGFGDCKFCREDC